MNGKRKSKETVSIKDKQQRVYKRIGERIKAIRQQKGHTSYEEFAWENDIDRSQFGRYERGADMRISSLVKVLAALDVSIQEFFSEGFDDI